MLWSKLLLEPSFPSLPGRPLSGRASVAFFLLNAEPMLAGKGWQCDFQERERSLMSLKGSEVFQVLVPTAIGFPVVVSELFVKCPNKGGYYCSKINLEPKENLQQRKTPDTRSIKPHKKMCGVDCGLLSRSRPCGQSGDVPPSIILNSDAQLFSDRIQMGFLKTWGERKERKPMSKWCSIYSHMFQMAQR